MDIKPFNEIVKDLEGAGSSIGTIDKLAEKLLAQGIATTKLEARDKARSMLNIEKNVTNDFTHKRKNLTTYNDPRNNPEYNKYREEKIQEMRRRAIESKPIKVQHEFQTPDYERKNGNAGLPRAVMSDRPQQTIEPRPEPTPVPEPIRATPEPRPPPEPITPTQESAPAAPEPVVAPAPPEMKPVEDVIKPVDAEPEQKRKKNLDIDLNSVFNFGKR